MSNYIPELGQMILSNTPYTNISTPNYVTSGIEAIDSLYASHILGSCDDKIWDQMHISNSGSEEVVNDVFAIRSYCWCDGERVGHENGCPANFEHFSSRLKCFWYKHAERGETINMDISRKAWLKIQQECQDWILRQPEAFRVLVTGSRDWASELFEYKIDVPNPFNGLKVPEKRKHKSFIDNWEEASSFDRELMKKALRDARGLAGNRHMVIIQGGAAGADWLARMLTDRANNAHPETHAADWNRQSDGSYDKGAGFKRNQKMVDLGADMCLAFFEKGSGNRGTSDCVARAEKAGIEVMEVWSIEH